VARQGKELLNRESANAVNIISAGLGMAGLGGAWQGWARRGKELLNRANKTIMTTYSPVRL
jgi:hypothetical protein